MGRIFITFILTSAFWIWYYSDYVRVEDAVIANIVDNLMEEKESEKNSTQKNFTTTSEPQKEQKTSQQVIAEILESSQTAIDNLSQSLTTPSKRPQDSHQKKSAKTPVTEAPTTTVSMPQLKESEATATHDSTPTAITQLGIANLYGKWQPIEGAEYPLEFTKYGAVIQHHGSIQMRYNYATQGEHMDIRYDKASFNLLLEDDIIYLEIYNSRDFSGRYKKISQPRKVETTILPKNEYTTLIVGKWNPIDGQEYPLELTKFGTAIQMHGSIDMRYDYTLNEDKMNIRYDKNARVVISEDANYYYLEIYNTTDFSGRYRKKK